MTDKSCLFLGGSLPFFRFSRSTLFLPKLLRTAYSFIRCNLILRYSDGVMPSMRLNKRPKWDGKSNPKENAVSVMDFPCMRRLLACLIIYLEMKKWADSPVSFFTKSPR